MGFADSLLAVNARLRESAGEVSGTYAQGTNTKSSVVAWKASENRSADGAGVDLDRCVLVFEASEFTSGFSSTNPVRPGGGDTYTISGEAAWTVDPVGRDGGVPMIPGATYELRCSRRRQRGGGA